MQVSGREDYLAGDVGGPVGAGYGEGVCVWGHGEVGGAADVGDVESDRDHGFEGGGFLGMYS